MTFLIFENLTALKEEKLAIEKNCDKDKRDLDRANKDLTVKNTECTGKIAVVEREKTKVEKDLSDLRDKFQLISRNLDTANDKRADESRACSGSFFISNVVSQLKYFGVILAKIADLEAKLAAAGISAPSHAAGTAAQGEPIPSRFGKL